MQNTIAMMTGKHAKTESGVDSALVDHPIHENLKLIP